MLVHTEIDIIVYYICPRCEWQHGVNPHQYLHRLNFIVCGCGQELQLAPPKLQDFAQYASEDSRHQTFSQGAGGYQHTDPVGNILKSPNTLQIENILAAIMLLEAQGFNKKELESIIASNKIQGSIDEIVSEVVLLYPTDKIHVTEYSNQ